MRSDDDRQLLIGLGFLDGLMIALGLDGPVRRERRRRRHEQVYGPEPDLSEPILDVIVRDFESVLGRLRRSSSR